MLWQSEVVSVFYVGTHVKVEVTKYDLHLIIRSSDCHHMSKLFRVEVENEGLEVVSKRRFGARLAYFYRLIKDGYIRNCGERTRH